MSSLFTGDGSMVGFDGSQINGKAQIASELGQIFSHHKTAAFVGIVKEVRQLRDDAALLRAVAGMVPPGKDDISPATNAIQSMVAVKDGSTWRIALFHNTPAQFHGRPELTEKLNAELRQKLKTQR